MAETHEDKAERVLSIFSRLKQGETIYKEEESRRYDITVRTVQRDLADIQCFLQNHRNETGEIEEVMYDKSAGGYRLETKVIKSLTDKEILIICKILLESRSLIKSEMFPILDKLTALASKEEKRLIKDLIGNEMHCFVELCHGRPLLELVWKLALAVKEQRYVEVVYSKSDGKQVRRKLKPVGIMFSEFYFYMTAFINDIDKKEHFQNPDDEFPTIYRIDRIQTASVLNEQFRIRYAERFEEGEFRKRIRFMYGGKLRKIEFEYTGNSPDCIYDRFPTAELVKKTDKGWVIKAEVFGDGIENWIRENGCSVCVRKPEELVTKIKNSLEKMTELYSGTGA